MLTASSVACVRDAIASEIIEAGVDGGGGMKERLADHRVCGLKASFKLARS